MSNLLSSLTAFMSVGEKMGDYFKFGKSDISRPFGRGKDYSWRSSKRAKSIRSRSNRAKAARR